MKECCANCNHLWQFKDWDDSKGGDCLINVCGKFASSHSVIRLYGDIFSDKCEMFEEKNKE